MKRRIPNFSISRFEQWLHARNAIQRRYWRAARVKVPHVNVGFSNDDCSCPVSNFVRAITSKYPGSMSGLAWAGQTLVKTNRHNIYVWERESRVLMYRMEAPLWVDEFIRMVDGYDHLQRIIFPSDALKILQEVKLCLRRRNRTRKFRPATTACAEDSAAP